MAEENSAPPQGEERGSAQKGANVQGEALPQGETRALGETGGKGEAGGAELMDTTDAPKQGLSLLLASAELISQGAEANKDRHPTLDARLTHLQAPARGECSSRFDLPSGETRSGGARLPVLCCTAWRREGEQDRCMEGRNMVRAAKLGVAVLGLYRVEEGEQESGRERGIDLGVAVPVLYGVEEGERCIVMQRVAGHSVKDLFLSLAHTSPTAAAAAPAVTNTSADPPVSTGTGTRTGAGTETGTSEDRARGEGLHPRVAEVAAWMGEAIAKLHDGGMVHGDLTTSNMLLSPLPAAAAASVASPTPAAPAATPAAAVPPERAAGAAGEAAGPAAAAGGAAGAVGAVGAVGAGRERVVVIDFGLSFNSTIAEDKAVDLYVLERALISLHSSNGDIVYVGSADIVSPPFKVLERHTEQAGARSHLHGDNIIPPRAHRPPISAHSVDSMGRMGYRMQSSGVMRRDQVEVLERQLGGQNGDMRRTVQLPRPSTVPTLFDPAPREYTEEDKERLSRKMVGATVDKAFTTTPFDGSNFREWALRFRMNARVTNLWEFFVTLQYPVTMGDGDIDDAMGRLEMLQADYSQRAALAFWVLLHSVSATIQLQLDMFQESYSPAYEAWEYLMDTYQAKDSVAKVSLMKQLDNLKMGNQERVEEYVNRATAIRDKLALAGKMVDEDTFTLNLLTGLPAHWEEMRHSAMLHNVTDSFTLQRMMIREQRYHDLITKDNRDRRPPRMVGQARGDCSPSPTAKGNNGKEG
ncbi:unnamed protein product [Closterium sp. NIES-64]|nr:unnamed protein product [Closterium sp. NIES-64]